MKNCPSATARPPLIRRCCRHRHAPARRRHAASDSCRSPSCSSTFWNSPRRSSVSAVYSVVRCPSLRSVLASGRPCSQAKAPGCTTSVENGIPGRSNAGASSACAMAWPLARHRASAIAVETIRPVICTCTQPRACALTDASAWEFKDFDDMDIRSTIDRTERARKRATPRHDKPACIDQQQRAWCRTGRDRLVSRRFV